MVQCIVFVSSRHYGSSARHGNADFTLGCSAFGSWCGRWLVIHLREFAAEPHLFRLSLVDCARLRCSRQQDSRSVPARLLEPQAAVAIPQAYGFGFLGYEPSDLLSEIPRFMPLLKTCGPSQWRSCGTHRLPMAVVRGYRCRRHGLCFRKGQYIVVCPRLGSDVEHRIVVL